MQVGELNENDAADFWALRLRAFRDEPEAFGSSYEEQARRPLPDVARDLKPGDGSFVLGARAPGLMGIAGLRRETRRKRRHRAELWGMYVSPEARGQGVGRALLDEILRRARSALGLEQIILTVMAHNQAAIGLYRAVGFEVYGHAPRAMLLGDRAFDEDLMRLELTRPEALPG
jgi:ribosomal protein S18 acetylase RimI-like enzyme